MNGNIEIKRSSKNSNSTIIYEIEYTKNELPQFSGEIIELSSQTDKYYISYFKGPNKSNLFYDLYSSSEIIISLQRPSNTIVLKNHVLYIHISSTALTEDRFIYKTLRRRNGHTISKSFLSAALPIKENRERTLEDILSYAYNFEVNTNSIAISESLAIPKGNLLRRIEAQTITIGHSYKNLPPARVSDNSSINSILQKMSFLFPSISFINYTIGNEASYYPPPSVDSNPIIYYNTNIFNVLNAGIFVLLHEVGHLYGRPELKENGAACEATADRWIATGLTIYCAGDLSMYDVLTDRGVQEFANFLTRFQGDPNANCNEHLPTNIRIQNIQNAITNNPPISLPITYQTMSSQNNLTFPLSLSSSNWQIIHIEPAEGTGVSGKELTIIKLYCKVISHSAGTTLRIRVSYKSELFNTHKKLISVELERDNSSTKYDYNIVVLWEPHDTYEEIVLRHDALNTQLHPNSICKVTFKEASSVGPDTCDLLII